MKRHADADNNLRSVNNYIYVRDRKAGVFNHNRHVDAIRDSLNSIPHNMSWEDYWAAWEGIPSKLEYDETTDTVYEINYKDEFDNMHPVSDLFENNHYYRILLDNDNIKRHRQETGIYCYDCI